MKGGKQMMMPLLNPISRKGRRGGSTLTRFQDRFKSKITAKHLQTTKALSKWNVVLENLKT
eukprot:2576963-Amphidinium_carterae.1